jgi:hypothetical protein
MSSRMLRYLVQTDPGSPGGPSVVDRGEWQPDLGQIGAVGIKELIETYNSGGSIAELLESLSVAGDSIRLVWRENGPGVGWEMRTAWSGIFGRFFARAFLESRGYTWFHSIRRSYNQATDSLAVIRIAAGEIADWICAKDEDAADEGDFVVAEAKGRHREGNLNIQDWPRSLRDALEQIDNTFVVWKGASSPEVRRTKGYAILVRWANEEKPSGGAIVRAVDPLTWGEPFLRAPVEKSLSEAAG